MQVSAGRFVGRRLRERSCASLAHRYNGLSLSDDGITLAARAPRNVPFGDIVAPPRLARATGFSAIALPIRDKDRIKVAAPRLRLVTVVRYIAVDPE